jgi:hypothetical protein
MFIGILKYLGMTVRNKNFIQEEMKRRLNLRSVCYHSVQNPLPSHLQSKNVKITIYKSIILPVVLIANKEFKKRDAS